MRRSLIPGVAPAALVLALHAPAIAQPCGGTWLRPFGEGVGGVEYPSVNALMAFDDDGAGPHLPSVYAGGSFSLAGGVPVASVARWDGAAWSPVGPDTIPGGANADVRGFAVFDDDGPGPHPAELYICGALPSGATMVAHWNGSAWITLPPVPNPPGGYSGNATAMAVFDEDGPGPQPPGLFVTAFGGRGVQSWYLARWKGSAWTTVLDASPGTGKSMVVFAPDGGSPALYFASNFFWIGGDSGTLWRWDGVTVTTVISVSPAISDLAVLDDDGAGPHPTRLFVGGAFTSIGGINANALAAFDGQTWSPVGTEILPGQFVRALAVHDPDGSGPARAVLDAAVGAGNVTVVKQWNGTSWTVMGTGFNVSQYGDGFSCLLSADLDASGPNPPRLFAGGSFTIADNRFAHNIAYWDSSTWRAVGNALDNEVHALLPIDTPALPRGLYAAGAFATADGSSIGIARWDGSAWSGLSGPGANNHVDALLLDQTTSALIAAGKFTSMSGMPANHIARWNGSSWSALSSGLNGNARALANFTESTGRALFAAGAFTAAGGQTTSNIARWNGATWSALGLAAAQGADAPINALAVFGSNASAALYAAGEFTHAGGQPAAHIARWNGVAWSALSSGTDGPINALAVFDDGSGPALFATGQFTQAGSAAAANIARWNGTSWSALGGGINGPGQTLSVFDLDGPGPVRPALFVGGSFTTAGAVAAANLASWDGASWTAVTPGLDFPVLALAPWDADGSGPNPPALFIGGRFQNAGGAPAPCLAALSGCSVCYANCDSSSVAPILNVNDFLCFQLKFASGDPYANCDGSTTPPVLNINDFVCFQTRFSQGCP